MVKTDERGVDITGQQSTQVDQSMLDWADYVITLCGHADEHCPVISPDTHKEHWPLPDPAKTVGTEQEILAAFRESRDDIQHRIAELIKRLGIEPERTEMRR